jgi:hypothetical protein
MPLARMEKHELMAFIDTMVFSGSDVAAAKGATLWAGLR